MIFPGDFKELRHRPTMKLSWIVLFLNVLLYIIINLSFDIWPAQDVRKTLRCCAAGTMHDGFVGFRIIVSTVLVFVKSSFKCMAYVKVIKFP